MYEALVAMDAPPNLIAWASSADHDQLDARELLGANRDPVWAMWLAAGAGVPLQALVEVAVLEAERRVAELSEARAALQEVLQVTRGVLTRVTDSSDALGAAERADALAEHSPGSYRSFGTQHVITPVATACAYLARASEALATAELSLSTQRLTAVQGYAALLGMGTSALVPSSTRALCLNPAALSRDPVQQQALYVPAASAEALSELLRAQERALGAADHKIAEAMNDRVTALLSPLVLA